MKYAYRLFYLLVIIMMPSLTSAKNNGRIEDVIFESRAKTIEFTLTSSKDINDNDIEQYADDKGRVLVLSVRGVKTKRKWIKVKDKALKKVLLYPSRKNKPTSILRIRFKKPIVDAQFMRNILVFVEDAGIRIAIPRPEQEPVEQPAPVSTAPSAPAPTPAPNAPAPTPPPPQKPDTSSGETPSENAPKAATTPSPAAVEATEAPEPSTTPGASRIEPNEARTDITAEPPSKTAASDPDEPQAIMPAEARNSTGLIFMPGVRTRDILAGFTDLSLRLEESLRQRKGTHRIAVIPFRALDKRSKREHVDQVSQAVMTNRLLKRPGIIQSDPDLLARVIEPLSRDDEGAINEVEARAAGVVVGADTLIKGTVEADGNGYTVGVRAFDIAKGHQLGEVIQEFEGDAFVQYIDQVRDERTPKGAMLRSAVLPGWGQLYQGENSRGAVYLTLFSATLAAGIGSSFAGHMAASEYEGSRNAADVNLRETANTRYAQANAFFVTSGMVWLAAMVDSAMSSRRSVTIKPDTYKDAR